MKCKLTTIDSILGLYWDNGKENGNYYIKGFSKVFYRPRLLESSGIGHEGADSPQ